MDLSDLPTATLIKELKNNPTDSGYISELIVRMDSGDLSDTDLISLMDVLLKIKSG